MCLRKIVTSLFPTGILSVSHVWSKLKCDIGEKSLPIIVV